MLLRKNLGNEKAKIKCHPNKVMFTTNPKSLVNILQDS